VPLTLVGVEWSPSTRKLSATATTPNTTAAIRRSGAKRWRVGVCRSPRRRAVSRVAPRAVDIDIARHKVPLIAWVSQISNGGAARRSRAPFPAVELAVSISLTVSSPRTMRVGCRPAAQRRRSSQRSILTAACEPSSSAIARRRRRARQRCCRGASWRVSQRFRAARGVARREAAGFWIRPTVGFVSPRGVSTAKVGWSSVAVRRSVARISAAVRVAVGGHGGGWLGSRVLVAAAWALLSVGLRADVVRLQSAALKGLRRIANVRLETRWWIDCRRAANWLCTSRSYLSRSGTSAETVRRELRFDFRLLTFGSASAATGRVGGRSDGWWSWVVGSEHR
jgi:hypothetical protein